MTYVKTTYVLRNLNQKIFPGKMTEILFAYSDTASPTHSLGPKTFILDLDETLVHSFENPQFLEEYEIYSNPEIYRKFHPTGAPQIAYSMLLNLPQGQSRIWGLYRPNMYEFLSFAKDYFDNILIWSAGIRPYVEGLVRQLFLESGMIPPKLVWSRDKCYNYQGYYHKPISELLVDISERPFAQLKVDPKSTLILDDKSYTFMQNPNNGILIPPFYPGLDRPERIPLLEDLLDRSDTALLKLIDWFERPEVRNSSDVRDLDKSHIFD